MSKSKFPTDMSSRSAKKDIYFCKPESFLWIPKPIRKIIGYVSMTLFAFTFFTLPFSLLFLSLLLFNGPFTFISICFLISVAISLMFEPKEWLSARKVGQLWYELLDFSTNISPDDLENLINYGDDHQLIIGMHPHGVIPFHAVLWAAYCDQYFTNRKTKKSLYGFGAAADIVIHLPFLKNIMGWLSAGSASYKTLKRGLTDGQSDCVNANNGRKPRHLFILPGGIAEIFTSTPKKHAIVCRGRRGLMRLSLETGAQLVPSYVFGGTDFFHNLATGEGVFSHLCRRYRIGITIFWGYFFLPFPFTPRVTMCIGEPILVDKWQGEGPIPDSLIDDLLGKYILAIESLFDDYKALAGYPHAELEVL